MTTATEIIPERLERVKSGVIHLRKGNGSGEKAEQFDGCVMNVVDWLVGGQGASDAPSCVDPVIRGFAIRINDASAFAEWRDELLPLAAAMANTKRDPADTEKRRFMCADWAIRTIAPMAFEFWAEMVPTRKDEALAMAAEFRAVAKVVDKTTANDGRKIAEKTRKLADAAAYAAAYADAAADFAAYAAAYADAAAYAAYAAADAADFAADSVDHAAAYAAKARAYRRSLFDESVKFLEELILVTAAL